MSKTIYESNDMAFIGLLEQALKDNQIPCSVVGATDVGLGGPQVAQIVVSDEYASSALEVVKSLTNEV